ncbi:MAG: CHASE2 domain-containing protein [Acidobacteriota bacterium]|nr:CHASE2 domain-containing protein [Acidobacteriota bacterium]
MPNRFQSIRTTIILSVSVLLVVVVTWFVPSLQAISQNVLFRLRGAIDPPADIIIVAIDDHSLQSLSARFGSWPWPRSAMATAIEALTEARPLAIGLDVIYSEASTPEDDRRLAAAIAHNGRVVLPAQLYETANRTAWLRPIPEFANAAQSIGHAHISPGVDGMARSIQLSKADDRAGRLWALSAEVVRLAERISDNTIAEQSGALQFGVHQIPVRDESTASAIPGVSIVRQNEMLINFAGPTGSFTSVSIADLIEGKTSPQTFAGKIVLIGATAASMGDSRIVPFMNFSTARREGGQEMPGVEIHANIINTIRNQSALRMLPDWLAFAVALGVILLSALVVRRFDGWRQLLSLGLILLAILVGSFAAFSQWNIVPPLPAMLTGFAVVIPLLWNRSLNASRELDTKLAALVSSQQSFLSSNSNRQSEFVTDQFLPQPLAWKLRAVDDLTAQLLARMGFINRILSSMDEAVLVADLNGRIVFANREAQQLFDCDESELTGNYFAEFLAARGKLKQLNEAIAAALNGQSAQLEFETPSPETRHFSLLLSALTSSGVSSPTIREGFDLATQAIDDARAADTALGVVALISDITKRVELDRIKTETLQLVSHELRTPLTSIQGLSDVLLKFPVAAEESREMLGLINSEAVRLSETINRYLDLTRLESGAQTLRLSPVNCQELIADCLRKLSVFAAERRIKLSSQIEPSLPELKADTQLMTQAISNLLSNAIKYSPPETEVIVSAERSQNQLVIRIKDQGFGIPPEAQERIFEKFFRLERDASSNVVGTGLGLSLVKEVVEQHGGQITVESAPGAGSTFTISLP